MKKEIEKYRAENPKITEQFADLKRQLGDVSARLPPERGRASALGHVQLAGASQPRDHWCH